MKRVLYCIVAIMLISVLCQSVCAGEFRTGCHVQVVNCQEFITLRATPGIDSTELTKIPLNSYAAYLGDAEEGFARINYEGTDGYVIKSYLKVVEDFSGEAVTLTPDERYNINLFLSNFTEQLFANRTGFFDVDEASDADLIDFAISFICSNKKEWVELAEGDGIQTAPWYGDKARLSDSYIEGVTEKYFGRTPADLGNSSYTHRDGYYYWDYTNDLFSPFGFACLYDVQKFNDKYYSVWFKCFGRGTHWTNDDCYLTLELAEEKFNDGTGLGYALICTDGSGDLTDRSSWTLQRYIWNNE